MADQSVLIGKSLFLVLAQIICIPPVRYIGLIFNLVICLCSRRGKAFHYYYRCGLTKSNQMKGPVQVRRGENFVQWDSMTAKFAGAANLPFLLLQLPQIILNTRNLMAGNTSALLAVPWLVMNFVWLYLLGIWFIENNKWFVLIPRTL